MFRRVLRCCYRAAQIVKVNSFYMLKQYITWWGAYSYNFKALFTCFQVAGSIPTAGPILRVLRNEGTPFALQAARPSRSSDDHVKWRSRLKLET